MAQLPMPPVKEGSPSTVLTAGVDASGNILPVADISCFPVVGDTNNFVTIWTNKSLFEVCQYTGRTEGSGTAGTLTIDRSGNYHFSSSGTTALSWSADAKCARNIGKPDFDIIQNNIADHETRLQVLATTPTTAGALGLMRVGTGLSANAAGVVSVTFPEYDAEPDITGTTAVSAAEDDDELLLYDASVYENRKITKLNLLKGATRSIFLSLAGGWTGTTLPDGGFITTETTTNKVNFKGTKMAAGSADQNHEFGCLMPANYDGGTITARFVFFVPSSTDASDHTIILGLQAVAFGDDATADTAYGTAQTVTETINASIAGKVIITSKTSAITIANTPDGEKWVQFRVFRTGADTYTGDITVMGVLISYMTDNFSDV